MTDDFFDENVRPSLSPQQFRMIISSLVVAALTPLAVLNMKFIGGVLASSAPQKNSNKRSSRPFLGLWISGGLTVGSFLWLVSRPGLVTRNISLLSGMISFYLGTRFSIPALTGGIGSGKSTASVYLRDNLGYAIVDADAVAKEVVTRGSRGFTEIVSKFGTGVVNPGTGELDRKALGSLVFSDPAKKKQLESITHPKILQRMLWQVLSNRLAGRRVIMDVPLLFESRSPLLRFLCTYSVLIDVDPDIQRRRLTERNPELSLTDVESRIKSQMPRAEKLSLADYVVTNNGDREALYRMLDIIFK